MSSSLQCVSWKSVLTALLIGAGSSAHAQVLRERDLGPLADDLFGTASANAGDVDGDGTDDFIVGAPSFDGALLQDLGRVVIYSGATGALIRMHDGVEGGDFLGDSVDGAGDVNGDGFADYIVGAPFHSSATGQAVGLAVVYSGRTGDIIWQREGATQFGELGISVSGIGDVDGDGEGDVIVGSDNNECFVFSASGQTIYHFTLSQGFGLAVAGLGDLNGDGVNDLVVGAPFFSFIGLPGVGLVEVYDGASGTHINAFSGNQAHDNLGWSLAALGDVDGDGVPDYVVGSPLADGNGPDSGFLEVQSGKTHNTLFEQFGSGTDDQFGISICGMGDVDLDGVPDYAVGAPGIPGNSAGRVRVCSGHDGKTIFEWVGTPGSNVDLGTSVASGDWNGDGIPDLLLGDRYFTTTSVGDVGCVDVELMFPAHAQNYGAGWPGKDGVVPSLISLNKPVVGQTHSISLSNSLGASTVSLLLLGYSSANIPTSAGGTLLVNSAINLLLPLPANGLTLTGAVPGDPALYGFHLFLQGLESDPFASKKISFSGGLELVYGFDLP